MKCLTDGCLSAAVSRGLCKRHYSLVANMVARGQATWAEIEAYGLSSPRSGHGGMAEHNPHGVCISTGCDEHRMCRGLCKTCYHRYASIMKRARMRGEPYMTWGDLVRAGKALPSTLDPEFDVYPGPQGDSSMPKGYPKNAAIPRGYAGFLPTYNLARLLERDKGKILEERPTKADVCDRLGNELGFRVTRAALERALQAVGYDWEPREIPAGGRAMSNIFKGVRSDIEEVRDVIVALAGELGVPAVIPPEWRHAEAADSSNPEAQHARG